MLAKWLDALCEGSFGRDADGRALFHPWGALGRGYAVPDPERGRRLRREMRRVVGLGLFGAPIVATLAFAWTGLSGAVATAGLLALLGVLRLRGLTRGLEPASERVGRAEHNARVVRALRRLVRPSDRPDRDRNGG